MFLFTQMFPKVRGDFYEPSWVFFQNFQIHVVDPSDPAQVQQKEHIVMLVGKMLDLHRHIPNTPHEKSQLQGIIEATAISIDRLVNEIYGINTDDWYKN